MKKPLFTVCGMFLITFLLMTTSAKAENPLLGSWMFSVTQAPWEYSKGKIIIEEGEEKNLAGKIIFDSGMEFTIYKITEAEEKVIIEMYIEGYPIRTIVSLNEDEISGYTETPDGNIPFSAVRELLEEKSKP